MEKSQCPQRDSDSPSSHIEVLFQKANYFFSLRLSIFVLTLSSYMNI